MRRLPQTPAALAGLAMLAGCSAPDRLRPMLDRAGISEPLRYPAEALRRRLEGDAVFRCTITAAGRAEDCRPVSASDPVFVPPAAAFLAQAPFLPATRDGRPQAMPGVIERVHFRLSHATDANPFL